MVWKMFLFFISWNIFLQKAINAESNRTIYTFAGPEVIVAGKVTAYLITFSGQSAPFHANVTLSLISVFDGKDGEEIVTVSQEIIDHGIIPLKIPKTEETNLILKASINCPGCNFSHILSNIHVLRSVRDVIIKPNKEVYLSGETIRFWLIILDPVINGTKNETGTVTLNDSSGKNVNTWNEIKFDESFQEFEIRLSRNVEQGLWTISVQFDNDLRFDKNIEILHNQQRSLKSSTVNHPVSDQTDIFATEEHFIELKFSSNMRLFYKPNLPFIGMIESISTEKNIRVRVKVFDNGTSIYSQDIDVVNGSSKFTVPAVLSNSETILLQAELVAIDGKDIENHYVLARKKLRKSSSKSNCYLLINDKELHDESHFLQTNDVFYLEVLSTCLCEQDLHYVISTNGYVTDWAQRRYEDHVVTNFDHETHVCRNTFSFSITSSMSPKSQLLVYYVHDDGEVISDQIDFYVSLRNEQLFLNIGLKVHFFSNEIINVKMVAEHSSFVCLVGGDYTSEIKRKSTSRLEELDDFTKAKITLYQHNMAHCTKNDVIQGRLGQNSKQRRELQENYNKYMLGMENLTNIWEWKCFRYSSKYASAGMNVTFENRHIDFTKRQILQALSVNDNGLGYSKPLYFNVAQRR